jgi:hypothetical protein
LGLNHGADRPAPHNPFRVAPSVQYVPIVHFYDDAYVDPTLVEDGGAFLFPIDPGVFAIHSSKKADEAFFICRR